MTYTEMVCTSAGYADTEIEYVRLHPVAGAPVLRSGRKALTSHTPKLVGLHRNYTIGLVRDFYDRDAHLLQISRSVFGSQ